MILDEFLWVDVVRLDGVVIQTRPVAGRVLQHGGAGDIEVQVEVKT
jgi:hypothetical protein